MNRKLSTMAVFFLLFTFNLIAFGGDIEKSIIVGDFAPSFNLEDQYEKEFSLVKNRGNNIVLLMSDRSAKEELGEWGSSIKDKYSDRLKYIYIISMPDVPFFLKRWVIEKFKGENENTGAKKGSVFIDWGGITFKKYSCVEKSANVFFIDGLSVIQGVETGKIINENKERLFKSIEIILSNNSKTLKE